MGLGAMQSLVAVRGDRPFVDLEDLAARLDPRQVNKMQLENLARAGRSIPSCPTAHGPRGAAETVMRRAQANAQQAASGQIGLFGGGGWPCRA
ncbi:hypothetical protein RAA17_19415 [Komagataeibacter rhaeticus]|nr:hypothetical protein [Komagataeibacter rhaeticus]